MDGKKCSNCSVDLTIAESVSYKVVCEDCWALARDGIYRKAKSKEDKQMHDLFAAELPTTVVYLGQGHYQKQAPPTH